MILDFLNKNMYRKYPIRGDMPCVSTLGITLPNSLISAIRLTLPTSITSVYVKKVNTVGNFVSISIADTSTGYELGVFKGTASSSMTSLNFEARPGLKVSGFLVVGEIPLEFGGSANLNFENTATVVEPSCLILFTPPAVTSFIDERGSTSYGSITLALDNLSVNSGSNTFTLQVVNKASTLTNADFSGKYRNCELPVIVRINTVAPDEDGNIDIYAITPLTVTVDNVNKAVDLTSDLEITDVCPDLDKISPPTNPSTTYYTDILSATKTEWQTWPRYAD